MTAEIAVRAWGAAATAPRLVADRENQVYEVQLDDGHHLALRRHRPGYQTAETILSELAWTRRLADEGFACPMPVNTASDQPFWQEQGLIWSAVTWCEGTPLGTGEHPFTGPPETFAQLGKLLRSLHDISAAAPDLSDLSRPSWDHDALLGPDPHWNRFWENPALTATEREEVLYIREQASAALRDLVLPLQLIHADAIQENILEHKGRLTLIDFDDSGWGHAPFELGVALIQSQDNPALPELIAGLCEGYGRPDWAPLMPLFIALRGMASGGWVISRLPADDPRHRRYAERMLATGRRFLRGS